LNIVKEICTKYDGTYTAEERKNISSPAGALIFQFQKGVFFFEGKKIIILIDEIGGAAYGTNPIQLIIQISNPRNRILRIYPKFFIDKVLDFILNRDTKDIPTVLRKRFQFDGDKNLIHKIVSDQNIVQHLGKQNLTLYIKKENPSSLILSPSRGISNIEEAIMFINILKAVGEKI
tara:strand:+ start:4231 stop:4758 length:528 start_codon:yes stop_codon:yes gene_type:complete